MNSILFGALLDVLVMAVVLTIIGNWMMFKKAGKPGWHSLIPFLNTYDEFSLCWKGTYGIIYLAGVIGVNVITHLVNPTGTILAFIIPVAVFILFVVHVKQCFRLAKAFGRGTLYGLFLVFFNGLAKIILGLGDAQYAERPCMA
ncbi:MAG: hypothetical protein IJH60_07035 [Eubacterium sp.]|nr:hypothetical protein [Eubacterium sp.]